MRLLPSLTGFCRGDIGIDPGADTTVLSARGGELVIAEPSVIAIDARTGSAVAAGSDALELLGRRGIAAIWPITDGTIVDLERCATSSPRSSLTADRGPGWSRRSPAG